MADVMRRIVGDYVQRLVLLAAAAGFTFSAMSARAEVYFVNAEASPGGSGRAWSGAFRDLQGALAAAKAGDSIWVAAGTYYPSTGDDRDASFKLKKGVSVFGGFRGDETGPSQRDWEKHRTILSGDIGKRGFNGDNVQHVVWGADDAVLDGFTITGGNSMRSGPPEGARRMRPGPPGGPRPEGPPPGRRPGGPGGGAGPGGPGGPIHISPQQILSGPGSGQGAGMINYQSAPTVRNCVFENNRAAKGGAVYNMVSTSFPPRPGRDTRVPVFVNCIFKNNFAMGRGGGVSNDLGTAPIFLNCVFEGNETPQKGGGMYNDFGCSPVLINCLFRGNKALSAAAMGNDGASSPILYHCTFTGNVAEDTGPSLYQGSGPANNPAIVRTVVWGNICEWESAGLYNWHDNMPVVEDSVIEGGYPGAAGSDPALDPDGVTAADVGYKPGDARFIESELSGVIESLNRYRPGVAAGPMRRGRRLASEAEAIPSLERIAYVNGAGKPGGDGRSWTTAYSSLVAALDDAARDGAEIWVAAGAYKPAKSDRSVSFTLRPGVKLYGGFTGAETRREERDWTANRTILSGDVGEAGARGDNSFHVVIGANGAVVDGFTIRDGHADGAGYDGKGGGMINYRRAPQQRPDFPVVTGYSPEVRNCTFTDNYARDGGAVYNYDRGEPRFIGCVFSNNRSENGGAVLDRVGVKAVYEDCQFTGNTAQWRGGAAYFDYGSRPVLTRCVFSGNKASGHGGAVFSVSRASQLENTVMTFSGCRFENNQARGDGGGAAFHDSSIAKLERCSFSNNAAGLDGGAVAVTGGSAMEAGGSTYEGNTAGGRGDDRYDEEAAGGSR